MQVSLKKSKIAPFSYLEWQTREMLAKKKEPPQKKGILCIITPPDIFTSIGKGKIDRKL